MPTSIHPFIRDFQGAREATGTYQDLSQRTVGHKLHLAAETANAKPLVKAQTNFMFRGAKQVMLRGAKQN